MAARASKAETAREVEDLLTFAPDEAVLLGLELAKQNGALDARAAPVYLKLAMEKDRHAAVEWLLQKFPPTHPEALVIIARAEVMPLPGLIPSLAALAHRVPLSEKEHDRIMSAMLGALKILLDVQEPREIEACGGATISRGPAQVRAGEKSARCTGEHCRSIESIFANLAWYAERHAGARGLEEVRRVYERSPLGAGWAPIARRLALRGAACRPSRIVPL
jgi:hypothetical protein